MFKDRVFEYIDYLSCIDICLFDNYKLFNMYRDNDRIRDIVNKFYSKYYSDNNKRYMVFGSSPARRGSSITGIPFIDCNFLYDDLGIVIDGYSVNKGSQDFLNSVIDMYGKDKFFSNFYMNFICPLGITNINSKGNIVNVNFYDNKRLLDMLDEFMIDNIKRCIDFGINTDICYCIGSGDTYNYLRNINDKYNFFDCIIPLEHPRYIMQYNRDKMDFYMDKYISSFNLIERK